MNCPEQSIILTNYFNLWMYGSYDCSRDQVPIAWWINPLRYNLIIYQTKLTPHMNINKNGIWRIKFSNFVHRIRYVGRVNK